MVRRRNPVPLAAKVVGGVAVAALAATGVAYVAGVFDEPQAKKRKPKKPVGPFSDDVTLEPWEEEAEAMGDVDPEGNNDEPAEADDVPVGKGTPDELCINVGAPSVGEDEEEYCVNNPLGDDRFAPVYRGANFATVPTSSSWPVKTKSSNRLSTSYWTSMGPRGRSGRAFRAKRTNDEGVSRNHAGVDLFGGIGDVVLAPEDGKILTILPFHLGTWAVYLRTNNDQVVNLGEVEKFSWRRYNVRPGDYVKRGQPLARLGRMGKDSSMLHFETYDGRDMSDEDMIHEIRNEHFRWFVDDPVPNRLLDPSAYLIMAATRTWRAEKAGA